MEKVDKKTIEVEMIPSKVITQEIVIQLGFWDRIYALLFGVIYFRNKVVCQNEPGAAYGDSQVITWKGRRSMVAFVSSGARQQSVTDGLKVVKAK